MYEIYINRDRERGSGRDQRILQKNLYRIYIGVYYNNIEGQDETDYIISIYIIEGQDESDEFLEDLTCAMGLLREQVIVA